MTWMWMVRGESGSLYDVFRERAQYEADRASIPLAMWAPDHVVRALIEHYDATDAETKRIVPLKRLCWPA